MRRMAMAAAAVVCVVFGAVLIKAGPLDPPAGPVASTYKTLNEVEPRIAINSTNTPGDGDSLFRISKPGSYYLTGNITGVSGKHGIELTAGGVTLDLNGFELAGVTGSLDGVSVTTFNLTNIAVVNGSVRDWDDEGVDLGTLDASNCRVDGVLASGNLGNGISIGFGSTISRCAAFFNTASGIRAGTSSTISNCSAYANGNNGIDTTSGSTISNCSAFGNTANGISTSAGCTISNCSAYVNTANGISTGTSCTISNCSAHSNSGSGITSIAGSTLSNCSAYSNGGSGIDTSNGSVVEGCTARLNSLDGITCISSCVVRGNDCSNNGNGSGNGAGIHVTGNDNRIEGNCCTGADRGVDVDVAGNIIVRNTCSGNSTNWDVVAGNVILVVNAATAAAVSGNSGGTAPGSTDPGANFTY